LTNNHTASLEIITVNVHEHTCCHGNLCFGRVIKNVIKYDLYVKFPRIFAHNVQIYAKSCCKNFNDVCQVYFGCYTIIFRGRFSWTRCIYTYIFGGSCPLTEFCPVQNSLYVQVLRSPILAALLQGTSAAGDSQTLRRGTGNGITELSQRRQLYSAVRPSRWVSAHILVRNVLLSLSMEEFC